MTMVVPVLIISCHVSEKLNVGPVIEPDDDDEHSSSKCPCAAQNGRGMARENTECVPDDAKEIAVLLSSFVFRPGSCSRFLLNFRT